MQYIVGVDGLSDVPLISAKGFEIEHKFIWNNML
jgi:hypothetical protein